MVHGTCLDVTESFRAPGLTVAVQICLEARMGMREPSRTGPSPRGGSPQKGNKKINKEKKHITNICFQIFIGDAFPKKLGLDSILESWDLKIRIPRRKLRIWSYSQVETRRYRSKYLKLWAIHKENYNCSLICLVL